MEIYENDQVDVIKRFFAKNGKALAVGVVLSIGALVGWCFWNSHQTDNARETSQAYESAVSALQAGKQDSFAAAKKFAADNKNSYGALASLELVQRYVEKNDLQKAAAQLQQGLAATSDENLRSIINVRLARIQIQLKKQDAALKTLDAVKGESWSGIVADLRGEALLSKGDKKGACAAWENGIKNNASPVLSEMMQMKISNLSIYEGPDAIV